MYKLYENIKQRRQELGINQTELAKRTGYSDKSMIARVEKGVVDLPQSKILVFAEALSVSPAYLMGWEDDTSPSVSVSVSTPFSEEAMSIASHYETAPEGIKDSVAKLLDVKRGGELLEINTPPARRGIG